MQDDLGRGRLHMHHVQRGANAGRMRRPTYVGWL